MEKMTIEISTEFITLVNLLKFAGIIQTGGQIKDIMSNELLSINGEKAMEKRKKIYPGSTVVMKGYYEILVIAEQK